MTDQTSVKTRVAAAGADDFLLTLTPQERQELIRPALEQVARGQTCTVEQVHAALQAYYHELV